ncbi:hypothetical protein PspLS_09647 [Pyricularia sp. CBS 133598]|nr:hypothetical protein PspLS_09647 [Pyricularia sp. CBS 133598]
MPSSSSTRSSQSLRSSAAAAVSTSSGAADQPSVPIEILVEHLLAAKRSLSSMTLVLEANDLTTQARSVHEDSVVLAARTAFLRAGIAQQIHTLERIRRGLARTYDVGRRDFEQLIKVLDDAGERLTRTMDVLHNTIVDPVFRPAGEEPRSLMFFVDEGNVDRLTKSLKESIAELKAAETSYDGDLLRFDNDIRSIKKHLLAAPGLPSPSNSVFSRPMADLVRTLTNHSHAMAENLSSLTRHFDLCVTAVRASEGGAALALRKAAEDGPSTISISGVIRGDGTDADDQEFKTMTARERDEMFRVVMQDATEVGEVVRDINAGLEEMQALGALVEQQAAHVRTAHECTLDAFRRLEEVEARLGSYVAAEREYVDRCEVEKDAIHERLAQAEDLVVFYEGYAGAYDGLVLEYERRRNVEDKIRSLWRKAAAAVEKLEEQDAAARDSMRKDVGDYIPGDLWVGMDDPVRRWKVVAVDEAEGDSEEIGGSSVRLKNGTVEAARERVHGR